MSFECPCPSCRNGKTDRIHGNGEMIGMAVVIKRQFEEGDLWEHVPKLSGIFRYRPSKNIYWQELIFMVNKILELDET